MKNLVMIHLESLSKEIYEGGRELFSNCDKWFQKSIYFSNHYSTATSTIMVIADLMYGRMETFENSADLTHFTKKENSSSLFQSLYEEGYDTSMCVYPQLTEKLDKINIRKILGNEAVLQETNHYEELREYLQEKCETKKPFATYIYDWTSLLSSPFKEKSLKEKNFIDSLEMGYRQIDNTVGMVFDVLEQKNVLQDTIVILFGDHGDEMWAHGFKNGFTHAIEPYPAIIHTPLAIYNYSMNPEEKRTLVNTTDLRGVVIQLLFESKLCIKNRKYSFSRNLFLTQKSDILNRSYAVTDGIYTLILSTRGLEMYLSKYSAFAGMNLLNFYNLQDKKIKLKTCISEIEGCHIEFMLKKQDSIIRKEFYRLYRKLELEIDKLQKNAEITCGIDDLSKKINYNIDVQCEIHKSALYNFIGTHRK